MGGGVVLREGVGVLRGEGLVGAGELGEGGLEGAEVSVVFLVLGCGRAGWG